MTHNNPEERSVEEWKVQVRDWWYSLQDEAAVAEWGVPEKYRVEIETIIKHQLQKAREEAYQAGRAYEAQQCRGSAADNHPNAPYELPELYPWKNAFDKMTTLDHSELDQDNK